MTHPALDADWGTNAEALARVAARNATFIIVNQMDQCRDIMRSKCKRTAFRRFVIEGAVVVVGCVVEVDDGDTHPLFHLLLGAFPKTDGRPTAAE